MRKRVTLALAGLLLATSPAAGGGLIDPAPFGPVQVTLADGRVVHVAAETHAFYRMLTQDGRLHDKRSPPPSESEVRAGIALRHEDVLAV